MIPVFAARTVSPTIEAALGKAMAARACREEETLRRICSVGEHEPHVAPRSRGRQRPVPLEEITALLRRSPGITSSQFAEIAGIPKYIASRRLIGMAKDNLIRGERVPGSQRREWRFYAK